MTLLRSLFKVVFTLVLTGSLANATDIKPLPGQTAVRVCADAHNLPYSNDKLEGYDNKIAAIIGEELGLPVEYYWFPQRIGFGRNTIKKVDPATGKFLCDLAMSIPNERGLYSPTSPAIATSTLINDGLADNIEYFQMMTGDARINAGRIISEALASGQIDVAFAWGPIAGYYASVSDVPMTVVPLNEFTTDYIFSFSLGVRHQDKAWKDVLNKILEKRKGDIAGIIAQYNMPNLDNVVASTKKKRAVYTAENGKVDGKTYDGWRVYSTSCFVCHGESATGTERGPNLLTSVSEMSEFRFRKKMLKRYFGRVNLDDPTRRAAFLAQISEEHAKNFQMPTWSDNTSMRFHISQLYAYLKARSDGAIDEKAPGKLDK